MREKGTAWLYAFCTWISRLALLNVLFLIFTFLGLGLFGLGPAIFAMAAVLRKWLRDEECSPLREFWNTFRSSFLYANKVILSLLACAGVLLFDLNYLWHMSGIFSQITFFVLCYSACLFIVAATYMLHLATQEQQTLKALGRSSLLLIFYKPIISLSILAALGLIFWISLQMQVLLLFFTFSVTGLVLLLLSNFFV